MNQRESDLVIIYLIILCFFPYTNEIQRVGNVFLTLRSVRVGQHITLGVRIPKLVWAGISQLRVCSWGKSGQPGLRFGISLHPPPPCCGQILSSSGLEIGGNGAFPPATATTLWADVEHVLSLSRHVVNFQYKHNCACFSHLNFCTENPQTVTCTVGDQICTFNRLNAEENTCFHPSLNLG